jgi:signal transduction histidine kinase
VKAPPESREAPNILVFLAVEQGAVGVRIEEREQPESPVPRLVVLSVIDQGPGVPRELRDRVFEAFFRARTAASRRLGLGLALLGHISKVHGGAAAFLEAEHGAHLEVVLPGWTADEPEQTRA